MADDGELDAQINHRILAKRMNWKNMSDVLHYRNIIARVKRKVYKAAVRPAMLYGSETWPVKKSQERKLEVVGMRMLKVRLH